MLLIKQCRHGKLSETFPHLIWFVFEDTLDEGEERVSGRLSGQFVELTVEDVEEVRVDGFTLPVR